MRRVATHFRHLVRISARASACLILLCSFPVPSFPQQPPPPTPEKNWQVVCKSSLATTLDSQTPPGPLASGQLSSCDETSLYYGIDKPPDYSAALQCGWYERAHPQSTRGNMFYGPGVLTMLYANGRGARQDYALAIRFACEQTWAAEAEMEYRIGHLEHLETTRAQDPNFDLCDDTTSGLSDGYCTSVNTRARDAVRNRKIDALASALPPAATPLFKSLQAAEAAFEQARIRNEVDVSGTSRGAFQLSEQAKLRDQFLINIERFQKADIPAASDGDLAGLDAKLNVAYQAIQQSIGAEKWKYGTVKPDGIKATESKWLDLVGAWLQFGRLAYPTLTSTRVRAQLIRLRLHQLHSLNPD